MARINKILFVINSLSYGGAERALSRLLFELEKISSDDEYHIILLEGNDIAYKIPKSCNVRIVSQKKSLYKSILFVKKYIKDNGISVVLSFLHFSSLVCSIVSFFYKDKCKFIAVHCDSISSKYSQGISGALMRTICTLSYSFFDLLVFKSEAMMLDFNKKYNLSNINCKVIYNSYNYNEIITLSNVKPNDFKSWYAADKFNILSVGRLHKQKRVIDLIKAVELIDKDINLIIVGDGPERNYLESYVKKSKITENVQFLGMRDDVFGIMKICHLYILCSEVEGFPNTLIEALICGLPVISSDCLSGPREILDENDVLPKVGLKNVEYLKYGTIYPVGNIDLLVNGIENAIENIVNNEVEISKDYSIDKVSLQYIELWCEE
ncbi:glycosyltransferase [Photobacterium kishitanii]|uniref:glycosyltransferase n=1 Tax=Photobacterium kishitanii TaxID=318456 RepID=UPI00273983CF|nr:glycosyltransferase [Photobacterium kishitanii]